MPDVVTSSVNGASLNRPPSADSPNPKESVRQEEQRRAPEPVDSPSISPRVLWTRGAQCQVLADVVSGGTAIRASADVAASCIQTGASLLVTRHLRSLDLCNVAVPHGFSPVETRSIVAAVGSGPHSRLAVVIAHVLGQQLEVAVRAVYGHHDATERSRAFEVLDNVADGLADVSVEAVQSPSPAAMVSALPAGTLLVVGAPGGSWFQRQFFGPGARIQAKAPGGTIVVKSAPARVYQIMQPATAFGPHMRVVDARQLADAQHLIVAERGKLLGLIPHRTLAEARPDLELRDIMESPALLSPDEDLDHAAELISSHPGSAIPVVDSRRRIIGTVTAADLARRALL